MAKKLQSELEKAGTELKKIRQLVHRPFMLLDLLVVFPGSDFVFGQSIDNFLIV